jgi:hypothetical protein
MEVTCSNCNHTTKLDLNFDVNIYACTNCVYLYQDRDGLRFRDQLRPFVFDEHLEVGQIGVFKDKEYTVTGLLIKEYDGFAWAEYQLQSKDDFAYLSEAAGHWIWLEEIQFDKKVGNHPKTVDHEDLSYTCYSYSYPKLRAARGFFDFDIFEKAELIEYINPPFLLSFERKSNVQTAYKGEHIKKSVVKKAFDNPTLPNKVGVGLVQPFLIDLRQLAITFCVVALLIIISNWYFNKDRVAANVLDTQLPLASATTKDFVSPSFTLQGSAAPLSVELYAPVSNSWVNVQVALVNEKTGDEVYASKDIEYYSGYTEGESWSEGSNSESFNLCGVPAGQYHLTISSMKAPEDVTSDFIKVKAVWSEPSSRNIWIVLICMIVVLVGLFYLERNFEERRWADSSYSEYNS